MLNPLITAINFLTILPVHSCKNSEQVALGKAAGWFPWVGMLVGALTAAAYAGLQRIFPPLLAAVLTVALWIALTGGLHLDGLADCCDGLFYSGTAMHRLEIMKDPHHGTFAGVGLTLMVLIKVVGLYSLSEGTFWLVLPLAGALSRWLLLPAGRQPNARPGGMGEQFAKSLPNSAFFLAAVPVVILAVLIGWHSALVIAVVHLFTWLVFRIAKARLGGLTGDVYGLIVELGEVLVLVGFSVKWI